MDACVFVLTINSMMAVYGSDRATEIGQLNMGDKVCVMEMDTGDWMKIHWSVGNAGHTGYLHDVTVTKPAIPTEPLPYEESNKVTPIPTPAPAPENHSSYPDNPGLRGLTRPNALVMQCFPPQSTPYSVVYVNGNAAIIGGKTGHTTEYDVIDQHDDQRNHVFYVALKRGDQERTVYTAFDYSQRGDDISAIRVKAPGGYDARDKCAMDWNDTKR